MSLVGRALWIALLLAGVSHTASAQEGPDDGSHGQDMMRFSFEGFYTNYRAPPLLRLDGSDAPPRFMGSTRVAAKGGFGGGIGADFTYDALILRIAAVRFMATGEDAEFLARGNGGSVTMQAMNTQVLELCTPIVGVCGIGARIIHDRWAVTTELTTGMAWAWGTTRATDAKGSVTAAFQNQASFYLRFHADVCHRPGSRQWFCLEASPIIYEFGWASGVSVGLRAML